MKIYTKTGDRGETSLYCGGRVKKTHPRMVVCGTLDEMNSHLGVAVSSAPSQEIGNALKILQSLIFELGSDIAAALIKGQMGGEARISEIHIQLLESEIDRMTTHLPPLRAFILPGGSLSATQIHVARSVCRRAERELILAADSEEISEFSRIFLNRLSDYLFTLARYENFLSGHSETEWKPAC
jgi:cob(I)alamin adenosyltransferase